MRRYDGHVLRRYRLCHAIALCGIREMIADIDRNTLRMLKIAHKHIFNCLASGQEAKAIGISDRLTGILRAKARQKLNRGWKIKKIKKSL